jgi:hypothetical protein
MILTETLEEFGEKPVPVDSVYHQSCMTGLEMNPRLPCSRPVTNCMNYSPQYTFIIGSLRNFTRIKQKYFCVPKDRILMNVFFTALNAVTDEESLLRQSAHYS